MTKAERECLQAAKSWWRARKPDTGTRREHQQNPYINTVNEREKRLARAVARLVAKNETPGHR